MLILSNLLVKKFSDRKFWQFLAIAQVTLLLILFLSWPPVSITFVVPAWEANYWSPLVSDFEANNKNIRINLVELKNIQGDVTQKIEQFCSLSLTTGDSICDVIYVDIVWLPNFAEKGLLMNLSEKISPEELEGFLDSEIAAGSYNNQLYRIPIRSDVGLLYYRQDLLAAAGKEAPKNLTDLVNISQAIQQQGKTKWGYIWQGEEYEGLAAVFVEVLQSFGGFWLNPNTQEVGLDKPEAIAAVNFLISTIDNNISPPDVLDYTEEESLTAFLQGDAVFLRHWPYIWQEINNSSLQGKIGVIPMFDGGALGSWGLGIDKNSPHSQAAWKVIKYLSSQTAQRQFILETGYIPSRKELFTDSEIQAKYPHLSEMSSAVKSGVRRPPIPQYAEASAILQEYLSAALRKQLTPEQAMKLAAEKTRELVISP